MEDKKTKLELACFKMPTKEGEKKDYHYGWERLNDIYDVWSFIGWLINTFDNTITFTNLQYYNSSLDDFNSWVNKVRRNNNIVAKFNCGKIQYQIEIKENNL